MGTTKNISKNNKSREEEKKRAGAAASLTIAQKREEACKAAGLTIRKVIRKLNEKLDAKKIQPHCDEDGNWSYSAEMEDHQAQLRAIAISLEVLDAMPPKQMEMKHSGSVEYTHSPEEREKIRKLSRLLSKRLGKDGVLESKK